MGARLKEAALAVRDGAAEVDALRLVGGGTNSRMTAVTMRAWSWA
jgi:hypothetical protein